MTARQFARTVTVLPVADIMELARWYEHALGMQIVYLHEGASEDEATNYAVLSRDGVEVHLILDEPPPYEVPWTKAGTGYLYLKVHDVEVLYQEVCARGVAISRGLQAENWGPIGFNLTDPSGNAIHVEQE